MNFIEIFNEPGLYVIAGSFGDGVAIEVIGDHVAQVVFGLDGESFHYDLDVTKEIAQAEYVKVSDHTYLFGDKRKELFKSRL